MLVSRNLAKTKCRITRPESGQLFWHVFRHIFWHVFRHVFRHVFWHLLKTLYQSTLICHFSTNCNRKMLYIILIYALVCVKKITSILASKKLSNHVRKDVGKHVGKHVCKLARVRPILSTCSIRPQSSKFGGRGR